MRTITVTLSNVPNHLLCSIQEELNEMERAIGIAQTSINDKMDIDYMQLPHVAREQLLAPIISAYFTCQF